MHTCEFRARTSSDFGSPFVDDGIRYVPHEESEDSVSREKLVDTPQSQAQGVGRQRLDQTRAGLEQQESGSPRDATSSEPHYSGQYFAVGTPYVPREVLALFFFEEFRMYDPGLFRKARRVGGFKLREIATEANLDPSTLASYEVRRATPSVGAAARWKNALIELMTCRVREMGGALEELRDSERD